jgi:NAD(P)-dependent dehydrogenase (short-subunit alcohol dehydrogenase family)
MLTKTVALELADKGIRVNGIAPGAIATDMNKEILENKEEKEKSQLIQRFAAIGKVKLNEAPFPGLFSAHILPPWVSTIIFDIKSPRPVPE